MSNVITTKYAGPTNSRGARIIATEVSGDTKRRRRSFPWNYSLGHERNHDIAARELAYSLKLDGRWAKGYVHNGGNVYVRVIGGEPDAFAFTVNQGED
jgi:hypothetical protein